MDGYFADEIDNVKNKQYLRYKDKFKLQYIIKLIGGACLLIAILFFMFLPIFSIKLEMLDVIIYEEDFSFYEEIKNAFSLMRNYTQEVSEDVDVTLSVFGIYQIFAVVFMTVGIIWLVIDAVKDLSAVTNPENYSVMQYDKIKTRSGGKKFFGIYRYSPTRFILSGILFECLYIFMIKIILKTMGSSAVDALEMNNYSKFYNMTGVTGLVVLPSIFFIGCIVAYIYNKITFNRIKAEIIKEDYNIKSV